MVRGTSRPVTLAPCFPLMSLRDLRRAAALAVTIPLLAACADERASASVTDSAVGTAAPASLAADSPVADSQPLPADTSLAAPSPQPTLPVADTASSDTVSPPGAAQDTTTPRPKRGLLGRRAGERHMAFRDAGSPLDSLWPVKTAPPLAGSILPEKRIVAFYGNPLSKRMGILGEFGRASCRERVCSTV